MPIVFAKSYQANGKVYATLAEAQLAELDALFAEHPGTPTSLTIMNNVDRMIDILTTTESSRPMARKANGGSKKRKAKSQPELPEITPPPQPTPQA